MLEYPDVPEPLSGFPYSNVVVSNDLIAVASQTPFDDTNRLSEAGFAHQAHQVFANLRRCLQAAGCDMADVIKDLSTRRGNRCRLEVGPRDERRCRHGGLFEASDGRGERG